MTLRMLVLGCAIAATTGVAASQEVSLRPSFAVAFAPANLVVRTSVEPNADNRAIEIVADAGDFYRSSMMELEGDRAPKTTLFEFRSLPPGDYQVTATVIGADGRRRAVARAHVNVVASATSH